MTDVYPLKSIILCGSFFGVILGIFGRSNYLNVTQNFGSVVLYCITIFVLMGFAIFTLAPEGVS
jgi:hypothetical protein